MLYWLRYKPSPGQLMRAREEAEIALRLSPGLAQARLAMAAVYCTERKFQRALDEREEALKSLPSNGDLWAAIGYTHRRLGNWEKVVEAFQKAADLSPRDADIFFDLGGSTFRLLRRYADAIQQYNRALHIEPTLYNVALRKGWVYLVGYGQFDTLRAVVRDLPANPGGPAGEIDRYRADFFRLARNPEGLLAELQTKRTRVFDYQIFLLPTSLYAAWAHRMRGDSNAAWMAFESSCTYLDSVTRQLPGDWRIHAARGLTLAGSGFSDEASQEARWLQRSEEYRLDHVEGPVVAEQCAKILAQAGKAEEACDEIERLLRGPSEVTGPSLRLDPLWEPIRKNPRFQALLTKYTDR